MTLRILLIALLYWGAIIATARIGVWMLER